MFDRGVVYRDPEKFGEYHLSYRTGDILSPKIESYEPLGHELRDFVEATRIGGRMEFDTALARSVVRMAEAADRSLALGGQAVSSITRMSATSSAGSQPRTRPPFALLFRGDGRRRRRRGSGGARLLLSADEVAARTSSSPGPRRRARPRRRSAGSR